MPIEQFLFALRFFAFLRVLFFSFSCYLSYGFSAGWFRMMLATRFSLERDSVRVGLTRPESVSENLSERSGSIKTISKRSKILFSFSLERRKVLLLRYPPGSSAIILDVYHSSPPRIGTRRRTNAYPFRLEEAQRRIRITNTNTRI